MKKIALLALSLLAATAIACGGSSDDDNNGNNLGGGAGNGGGGPHPECVDLINDCIDSDTGPCGEEWQAYLNCGDDNACYQEKAIAFASCYQSECPESAYCFED